jgi:hypothetical protein
MPLSTRPYKVIVDDSLDPEESGLFQILLREGDREHVTRQILKVLGDSFDEAMEPSAPGHTVAEVLATIDSHGATAAQWEVIGPRLKPAPAFVALVPSPQSHPAGSRPHWISFFDRPASAGAPKVVAVVEVHAASRTALADGIVRGTHALFQPTMDIRKVALSAAEEASSLNRFLGTMLGRPVSAQRADA